MWLAGPDHRPLIMVYFHGPEEWHNTKWKVDSKFEKGKPGWAELQSEKVTLRLSMNTETGEAEVQSGKFKISESNTFLVLHTGEPSVPQKIISLGIFDLPASKDQPASVLLLRANPQLMERINKEAAAGEPLAFCERDCQPAIGADNWRNIAVTPPNKRLRLVNTPDLNS